VGLGNSSHGIRRPLGRHNLTASTLILIGAAGSGLLVFLFVFVVAVAPYFSLKLGRGATEQAFKAELDRSAPRILRQFAFPAWLSERSSTATPPAPMPTGFRTLRNNGR
jgi:hypothetical protein